MPLTRLGRLTEQGRDAFREAAMLARLTRDLRGFMGSAVSPGAAVERVRQRLARREVSFLAVVQRAVFQHVPSPYGRLLRHVGCEWGDFEALVERESIEGALAILADQGVYVTFDEFKARRPIVRGSATFHVQDRDFDSPLVTSHYLAFTGGSGGQPGRVLRPLSYIEELSTSLGASFQVHGVDDPRILCWLNNPVTTMLFSKKLGQSALLWLHPLPYRAPRARFGAAFFRLVGDLTGQPLPQPHLLVAHNAARLARWLDRRPRDGRPMVVHTVPSSAVRVATAATAAGIDLSGVLFYLQSEPLTEARRRHIIASGAEVIAMYTSIEMSLVGISCATPMMADDYHLMTDRFALVSRMREVLADGPQVPAMLLTTLTEPAPKICFNTELGDYATVEQRDCGCGFGSLGLTTHLTDVRSFEKLSGEGVTFVTSSLLRILEDVLPARFGGTAVDYQLGEEEGADSATRLVLRISPSVGAVDEVAVKAVLLAELAVGGIVRQHHAELLRRAGSVVVVREAPLPTMAGKVLPLQLLRRGVPAHS